VVVDEDGLLGRRQMLLEDSKRFAESSRRRRYNAMESQLVRYPANTLTTRMLTRRAHQVFERQPDRLLTRDNAKVEHCVNVHLDGKQAPRSHHVARHPLSSTRCL
jgi:hypothetical protein